MTVSIGIARFDDREGLGAEEMLDNADRAMYDAKRAGGDAWMRYDPSRHARKGGKSASGSGEEIAHAIDHNGLVLLAQPVIALAGDRSTQYELLLRMRDRRGDLLEPASFLYTAERLGLAGQIDRWVTARGIDTIVEQRALGRDLRLEVNLSGHTIGDDALLELIGRRLRETGIPPDRLIFEVAETAAVAQIAHSAAFARHLSELGCKLALDDFGAGFGSFYYLKHLPSDYLKIDREFVSQCARNSTNRTMIGAIVHIAREMGKQTIAECADDQETVDVLTDLGVDYAQGFHLGRPAPLAEYLAAEDRGSP
jgi:EAL domain-containing protein (putative c-di-GMP-specific phosphodiesterase class I)